MIGRGAALAIAVVLCAPSLARARTVFGFLPPSGAPEAAALQSDLLARLERTRRYALLEISSGDLAAACAQDARLEKAAQLALTRHEKFSAEVRVHDCASGETDAVAIRASSGKLASLAGALRQDFIDAYPLLVGLEVEGGSLLIDAGPTEKVEVGSLLYSYAKEGAGYVIRRRLRVTDYDEGRFRSRLEELFRLPGAGAPAAGEQLSPRALFAREAKTLTRPAAPASATRRMAGAAEIVAGGVFSPPIPDGPLAKAHALQESGGAVGRSLAAWAEFGDDGVLRLAWHGDSNHRAELGRRTLRLYVTDEKGRELLLATMPLPQPIATGARTRVLFSWLGPWTEIYVGGRFVGGLEDLAAAGRTFELGASGNVRIFEPELFELGAPRSADNRQDAPSSLRAPLPAGEGKSR